MSLAGTKFPEDGTGRVSRWYYNPQELDVVDETVFLKTLESLRV